MRPTTLEWRFTLGHRKVVLPKRGWSTIVAGFEITWIRERMSMTSARPLGDGVTVLQPGSVQIAHSTQWNARKLKTTQSVVCDLNDEGNQMGGFLMSRA